MADSAHAEDDKLEALTNAYLIVAASDGEVAAPELARYRETLGEIAQELDLDLAGSERRLQSALDLFRAQPGRARDAGLARISAYREDAAMRDALIRISRVAAVADRELEPQEEYALREIADMLDMKPGAV